MRRTKTKSTDLFAPLHIHTQTPVSLCFVASVFAPLLIRLGPGFSSDPFAPRKIVSFVAQFLGEGVVNNGSSSISSAPL